MLDSWNEMVAEEHDSQNSKSTHLAIHTGKPHRLQVKITIPVKEHPSFNFVGKLLGPKGSSLKQLQEVTQTRMAILGRGSMRDKKKEEELRAKGETKYAHLNDELHVEVSAFAPPAEAYRRIAHAIDELARFLVPDYSDDIRQYQMQEMGINGRGGPKAMPPPAAGYGYEDPAAAPPRPPPARGSGYWAGSAPSRGAAAVPRRAMPPRAAPAARRTVPAAPEYSYDDGYSRYDAPAARNDYYGEVPMEEAPDFAVDEYAAEPRAAGGPVRSYPRARPYAAGTRPY